MKKLTLLCLLVVLVPLFARAQGTINNSFMSQLNTLWESFNGMTTGLTNAELYDQLLAIQTSINQLSATLSNDINDVGSVSIATSTPSSSGSSGSGGSSTGSSLFFTSYDFGRGTSTINKISVYPGKNRASVYMYSDQDEVVQVSFYPDYDDEGNWWGSDYNYSYSYVKGSTTIESEADVVTGVSFSDIINTVDAYIHDMATTTALVNFLLQNDAIVLYQTSKSPVPAIPPRDCYTDAEKAAADEGIEALINYDAAFGEPRKYIQPISSITEYTTPVQYDIKDSGSDYITCINP